MKESNEVLIKKYIYGDLCIFVTVMMAEKQIKNMSIYVTKVASCVCVMMRHLVSVAQFESPPINYSYISSCYLNF